MEEGQAKEALVKMSGGLVALKAYESKLTAVLQRIREESLERLKWYESRFAKLMAIICHHESRPDLVPDASIAFREMVSELKWALVETPDDHSRHDLSGGPVDQSQRTVAGADGPADSPSGEPDGSGV